MELLAFDLNAAKLVFPLGDIIYLYDQQNREVSFH